MLCVSRISHNPTSLTNTAQFRLCFQRFYHILYYLRIKYNTVKLSSDMHYLFSRNEVIYTKPAEANAFKRIARHRTLMQGEGETLLFDLGAGKEWGSDTDVRKKVKAISQHTAVLQILPDQITPAQRKYERCDEKYMLRFLEKSSMDKVVYNPTILPFNSFMPNGNSLLDFVSVDSQRLDCWCVSKDGHRAEAMFKSFQATKGLGLELLDNIIVKEILIGRDSEKQTLEKTIWAVEMMAEDTRVCPKATISMDVEALQVLKQDFDSVVDSARSEKETLIANLKAERIKKGSSTQLPVRVMIGNGHTWALMITLLTSPVSKDRFKVDPPVFQQVLLQFLRSLPTVVGVGIAADVQQMEEFIRATSDHDFRFKGFVDIPCLAVMAGWNFPYHNMQALSVQCFGTVLNKEVSCGDFKWGLCWEDIPDALKVYCLGDIKFGHQAACLFFTILLRDMFPDPDIVLSLTRIDGHGFMKWFCRWIVTIIEGLEVDHAAVSEAKCRRSLLYALRYRRRDGSRASTPPTRVLRTASLLGSWPSVTFGGPRFLHLVRKHFIFQCHVLSHLKMPAWLAIMPFDISLQMETSATYSIPGLDSLDPTVPIVGCPRGLGVHPQLSHLMWQGEVLSSESAGEVARNYNRVRREVVYEWVRLNLSSLQRFFVSMPLLKFLATSPADSDDKTSPCHIK